jgi:Uma2 family endonuclease
MAAMGVAVERYRFTVDEFHRLAEAGILGEDDRAELIEGEIVMMTPIGLRHASCVDRLTRLLVQVAGEAAIVRVQNPVVLGERSEPQPDFALLAPRDDFYAGAAPGPGDVLLAIEVADSSLGYDRGVKLPLYGRSGIREVWIVDLGRGCVDAYRGPAADGYAERRTYRPGESLPLPLPGAAVAVAAVLPD